MQKSPPSKLQAAITSLLNNPGVLRPELRQAIEAHAAMLSGGEREPQEIPANLLDFIHKIVFSARQITDGDFKRLVEAGYSEESIFEVALCASVGAGLARMERGLMALQGRTVGAAPRTADADEPIAN